IAEKRQQIHLGPFRDPFQASEQHLLAAACGRDQPDAYLHEPDVDFGGGADPRGVQTDLASAAERHGKWGRYHRLLETLERHVGILEGPYHQLDVVPVLLLRLKEEGLQVRADTEVSSLIPDDEGIESLGAKLQARPYHLKNIRADGVVLGGELQAGDPISQVDQRCAGIASNHLLLLMQRLEMNDPRSR